MACGRRETDAVYSTSLDGLRFLGREVVVARARLLVQDWSAADAQDEANASKDLDRVAARDAVE